MNESSSVQILPKKPFEIASRAYFKLPDVPGGEPARGYAGRGFAYATAVNRGVPMLAYKMVTHNWGNKFTWLEPSLQMLCKKRHMMVWWLFWRTRTLTDYTNSWMRGINWVSLTGSVPFLSTNMQEFVPEHPRQIRQVIPSPPVLAKPRSTLKAISVPLGPFWVRQNLANGQLKSIEPDHFGPKKSPHSCGWEI